MKKKEKQSLWQKKIGELQELTVKKKEELAKIRLAIMETKDKNLPKKLKKEIALILTILEEKKFKEALKKRLK